MKLLSLRGVVLFVFTVQTLIISQPVWAGDCSELIEFTSFKSSPIVWAREQLPAIVSRVRPTYRNKDFDIRIVSTSPSKNAFNPQKLKKKAIDDVSNQQRQLRDLGFTFNSFVQILIAAHPGAIRQASLGENGKIKEFIISKETTAWVGSAFDLFVIPGVFSKWHLFWGTLRNKGFSNLPRFLIFPAISDTYHSIEGPSTVAHELGHLTEPENSHKSFIWKEARADLLAYLVTGGTDLIYPEGLEVDAARPDGTVYQVWRTKMRSISEPIIENIDQIYPNIEAFHQNSEIISSILFQISEKLGTKYLLEFIHWMDSIEDENLKIPQILATIEKTEGNREGSDYIYINNENVELVRDTILKNLEKFRDLLKSWASSKNENDIQVINEILKSKGL